MITLRKMWVQAIAQSVSNDVTTDYKSRLRLLARWWELLRLFPYTDSVFAVVTLVFQITTRSIV